VSAASRRAQTQKEATEANIQSKAGMQRTQISIPLRWPWQPPPPPLEVAPRSTIGADAGTFMTVVVLVLWTIFVLLLSGWLHRRRSSPLAMAQAARSRMPKRIILIRHGQSEGNADHTLYRTKADNLIELTQTGIQEANAVGGRLKKLLGRDRVHLVVSPFERTLQTARCMRTAIETNIIHTYIEPRVREQEFGNLQGDEFKTFREEQKKIGRFFYRFPTGESGADVHARCTSWWEGWVRAANLRPGVEAADALVIVTHGLTMRLILMQLYGWSPNTFSTIWNAGNCEMYVLKRDLSYPGNAPYYIDKKEGDYPKSSLDMEVSFTDASTQMLPLNDYLSIAPPRTCQVEDAVNLLVKQHGLEASTIKSVDFFSGRAGYDREAVPPLTNRRLRGSAILGESSWQVPMPGLAGASGESPMCR